jgi:hypothetical protein
LIFPKGVRPSAGTRCSRGDAGAREPALVITPPNAFSLLLLGLSSFDISIPYECKKLWQTSKMLTLAMIVILHHINDF